MKGERNNDWYLRRSTSKAVRLLYRSQIRFIDFYPVEGDWFDDIGRDYVYAMLSLHPRIRTQILLSQRISRCMIMPNRTPNTHRDHLSRPLPQLSCLIIHPTRRR